MLLQNTHENESRSHGDVEMLQLDGSMGEGGGQILRSALALSLATGQAFRMDGIRAGRSKPGLLRQHLTAVEAATAVGGARVAGAALRSGSLSFEPTGVKAGDYRFAVGTAGSATLVLQTVLPALLTADGPSTLVLEGGTHNPFAPPFEFLARAFLPQVKRMGPEVEATLERPGFYPAGGGRFRVTIEPSRTLRPIDLVQRGREVGRKATAYVAQLSPSIGSRELRRAGRRFTLARDQMELIQPKDPMGPGNILLLELEHEHVTEIFSGFGERAVRSEQVADEAVDRARRYLSNTAPVGEYLADQLLVPLALAGGGAFRTFRPSRHTRTNMEVVKTFLGVSIEVTEQDDRTHLIELRADGE